MKPPVLGKLPPQAIDMEKLVLRTLLNDRTSSSLAFEILKPDHFYKQDHQAIFESMVRLYSKHNPIDIETVADQLRKADKLEQVGGAYELVLLSEGVTAPGQIEYHCRIIQQAFFKREIIRIGTEAISEAYEESSDVFDLVDKFHDSYGIIESEVGRPMDKVGDIFRARLKAYEEVVQNGVTGVPSGFTALDRITAGWQKTDLVIVAARPAMGKTAFMLTAARNAAIDFKVPVGIFSLEMSKEQLVDRLVSAEAEIESEVIRKRSFSQQDFKRLLDKSTAIDDAMLFIDDTAGISVQQFRAKAKKLKKDHDVQLIIIDYLQLMRGEREKGVASNREQEIGQISRALKAVAKELNIPVMALSQLSRAVETRAGGSKKPMLSDLRESGSIEQDADMVLFLYRPEYYGLYEDAEGRSTIGIGEVIVGKHRNGPTDTAVLRFVSKFTKFSDLEDNFGFGEVASNQFPKPVTQGDDFEKPSGFVLYPSRDWEDPSDEETPF